MPDDIALSEGSQNHKDGGETADHPTRRVGRRKMLLGVAAGGVGAGVVARAAPAGAETPDAGTPKVKLGKANTAAATTSISMAVNGDAGIEGRDTSSGGGYGLYGTSAVGTGIYGSLTGDTNGHNAVEGVDGSTGGDGGAGVYGSSTNGTGIFGTSTNAVGVYGIHTTGPGTGVAGLDQSGNSSSRGVYGSSGSGNGVYGVSTDGTGVYGTITGDTNDHFAVQGVDASTGSEGGVGVGGSSTTGTGVQGFATGVDSVGVLGSNSSENGIGVYATSSGENGVGLYATSANSNSLYVIGNATVTGSVSKGGGSFKIDHPADPENKYLYHSFVESPDMMNVYNGNVTLDIDGKATVELPDWFEALNRDFRYQLTPIVSFAPLYISKEIGENKFEIAGGNSGQRVSWQVTGIRQDAWANANRIPVEVDKKEEDRGCYLHPELFGGEAISALAKARDSGRRHRSNTTTASTYDAQL
ncbi:MAG: hypothetical protein WAM97_16750 [Acidimicrobiales bacterium]